ncbi:MAG: multidrug efflux pump [Patescibacteria group bacterium]|nr:multidrug efflux pump [Patescibacteria group bacterium]
MKSPSAIPERIAKIREELESGFLGFWVKKYRISYILVAAVFFLGTVSLVTIPKESSPSIKFGMIAVTTVYPGTNPVDMDSLVTDKLYKEVKDIDGIKKITSTSSLGMSMLNIELEPSARTADVMAEVRNNIGRAQLPSDAKDPTVMEIKTDTNRMFTVTLYSEDEKKVDVQKLRELAQELKDRIEKVSGIESVDFDGTNAYELRIAIPEETLRSLGLSVDDVATAIRSVHRDAPIGNFEVGNKKYDFRIEGKYSEGREFLDTPIPLPSGKSVRLADIAELERSYKDKSVREIGFYQDQGPHGAVELVVNKNDGTSIFSVAADAKGVIEEILKRPEYSTVSFQYSMDLADNIIDDYKELLWEAFVTFALVFVVMYLFVGFRDSLFATLTLPLAFLSTFALLNYGGYTLNFLTNFSFILSFGIAVDTIIVIVQAASAKQRVGYDPKSAILLALKEYAIPILSGVMTTIMAFLPMMTLPGVMGKFLAFIPLTIFGVLATGLALALTVNSALYLAFVGRKNTYVNDANALEYATEEERELLAFERLGKKEIAEGAAPLRIRMIHIGTEWYKKTLRGFLESTTVRRTAIALPIAFFLVGSVILAPKVGFILFPSADNALITYSVEGAVGEKVESFHARIAEIYPILAKYPEIKFFKVSAEGNVATVTVQLHKLAERKERGLRNVFVVEELLTKELDPLRSAGLKVESTVLKGGPPSGKAVGLKLNADSSDKLDALVSTSEIFEKRLRSFAGMKNVSTTSGTTPGQFVFVLKKDRLAEFGIPAAKIYSEILTTINGSNVGSIENDGEDIDVVVKVAEYSDAVDPQSITGHNFAFGGKTYRIGDFVDSTVKNAVASVKREDGKITVTVEGDVEKDVLPAGIQSKFEEYADSYAFPTGISYSKGGENEANKDLIVAVLTSFVIALAFIFGILVLQFNSFAQPFIIIFSVVMALPFIMLGLLWTGNPFSMPFGIGFISFTGIAVNHGIILIDAINQNLKKGMKDFTALVEAGSSRLEPMTLTTLTTTLGILPIALRDEFWSGLGFTIIFGLVAASVLTLFVVKGIYYEVFMAEHPLGHKLARIAAFPFRLPGMALRTALGTFAHKPVSRKRRGE